MRVSFNTSVDYVLHDVIVTVTAKPELLSEVEQVALDIVRSNVTALKTVCTFARKCNHFCHSLMFVGRSFKKFGQRWTLHLWMEMCTLELLTAVWSRRKYHPVTWFLAFLKELTGTLVFNNSLCTDCGIDPSPWGLGGWLEVDGTSSFGIGASSPCTTPSNSTPPTSVATLNAELAEPSRALRDQPRSRRRGDNVCR